MSVLVQGPAKKFRVGLHNPGASRNVIRIYRTSHGPLAQYIGERDVPSVLRHSDLFHLVFRYIEPEQRIRLRLVCKKFYRFVTRTLTHLYFHHYQFMDAAIVDQLSRNYRIQGVTIDLSNFKSNRHRHRECQDFIDMLVRNGVRTFRFYTRYDYQELYPLCLDMQECAVQLPEPMASLILTRVSAIALPGQTELTPNAAEVVVSDDWFDFISGAKGLLIVPTDGPSRFIASYGKAKWDWHPLPGTSAALVYRQVIPHAQ